jgi:hypothetical protein
MSRSRREGFNTRSLTSESLEISLQFGIINFSTCYREGGSGVGRKKDGGVGRGGKGRR